MLIILLVIHASLQPTNQLATALEGNASALEPEPVSWTHGVHVLSQPRSDSSDSSDISELYLDDDSEGFDVAIAEYEPMQRYWAREPMQCAPVSRPQTNTTGFTHAR
jgi:hypothetical protein